MRGKTQSGKKHVQPGKQVVAATAHHRRTGRKTRPAKSKSLSRDLAARGVQSLATLNPQQLIVKAISKGDISTVEKLLQMQRELAGERAKKEYRASLAHFQRICPVIPKTKVVRNKPKANEKEGTVRYRYAPLDVIIGLVHEPLAECGFSYMIKGEQKEKEFTAIMEGYHVGGHCEVSRMSLPIEKSEYMNAPQSVASAQTYAKRQAFCNLWGIVTTDTDDDARSAGLESENGAKATDGAAERIKDHLAERNVSPGTLPENPGIQTVEKLLKQMSWLPETTAAMYRKQAKTYSDKNDNTSMRGLQQALNKQIATKGAKKP